MPLLRELLGFQLSTGHRSRGQFQIGIASLGSLRSSALFSLIPCFLRCFNFDADAHYRGNSLERMSIQRKPPRVEENSANGGIRSGSSKFLVLRILRMDEPKQDVPE